MMYRVVKPFPFAGNGYAVENLSVGDERDFGASTDGLLAGGYIAGIGAAVAEPESEAEPVVDAVTEETATEDTAAPRRGRQRRG